MIASLFRNRLFVAGLLAALLSPVIGCAGTTFDVQSAPGWPRASHLVSTFGVKRDGLMMRDGWHALGPEMPAPFGAQQCAVVYDAPTLTGMPDLGTALDEYIRAHGVTDQLLTQFAPAALGDTILFIEIYGSPQYKGDSGPPSAAAMGGRGRVGMQGGAFGGGLSQGGTSSGSNAMTGFGIYAVLYSVADKKSVAEIRMNYAGKRIDHAIQLFNTRFEKEFPGAHCRAWNLAGKVDVQAIKSLPAPK